MISLLGFALLLALGALLQLLIKRVPFTVGLRSPSSYFIALVPLYAAALNGPGLLLIVAFALAVWLSGPAPQPMPQNLMFWLLGLLVVMLARPWVPTLWDEFVWLSKTRFAGFDDCVDAALDPTQKLLPAGYPPLWPLAVNWVSFSIDDLSAHVVGATLLTFACAATAVEAWAHRLKGAPTWALALLFSAPLVLVHVRSIYVDLPIGLLSLALLGHLMAPGDRAGFPAAAIAVALVGFKDEGLAHVLAASVGAVLIDRRQWKRLAPAFAAGVAAATWRLLVIDAQVPVFDHGLHAPAMAWLPHLFSLLALHATDVWSWGLFWAVTLGAVLVFRDDPEVSALKRSLGVTLLLLCVAVLSGPERVRVFAENGTLFNRLLLQLWPMAAMIVFLTWRAERPAPTLTDRAA